MARVAFNHLPGYLEVPGACVTHLVRHNLIAPTQSHYTLCPDVTMSDVVRAVTTWQMAKMGRITPLNVSYASVGKIRERNGPQIAPILSEVVVP